MTLFIACILIYGFKLHWVWYIAATFIWIIHMSMKGWVFNVLDDMQTEIIQNLANQNINISETPPGFTEKDIKKWRKHMKDLH